MLSAESNMYCRTVQGGKHKICFFPCLKYNYWEVSDVEENWFALVSD